MATGEGQPRRGLSAISSWMRAKLFGAHPGRSIPSHRPAPRPREYNLRKQRLPIAFSAQDWERCVEYWGYRCAICERPRGLWHTLAQDHWIPLTHADCPGTVPYNILPLCHGTDGCNNSKGKKDPREWLITKLGTRRANRKLREIEAYFEWVYEQMPRRLGCPCCGTSVRQGSDLWECKSCGAAWDDAMAQTFANCPTCQCWMIDPADTGAKEGYYCPRCEVYWQESEIPGVERCPGCRKGLLQWTSDEDGENYWYCQSCGKEWVDDA